jgi:transcriptional regulator with XRE-family HTH domain
MVDANEINETVGRRLRLLREANGWSQREMARKFGISYNKIFTLESAKTGLRVDDLFLIAGMLGVSSLEIVQDLLTARDLLGLNRAWQIEKQAIDRSRERLTERLAQITDQVEIVQSMLGQRGGENEPGE